MTLAQVQATMAFITFLIFTWAGLILAVALLLPKHTSRAELQLSDSPMKSFFVGLVMLIPIIVGSVLLRSTSGAAKLLGFAILTGTGAALAIGASGIALLMGRRISDMAAARSSFASMVRGSIVFSLALGFPIIGWFAFLPVSLIMSLGSGTRAILRSSATVYPPVNPAGPEYDVLDRRGAI